MDISHKLESLYLKACQKFDLGLDCNEVLQEFRNESIGYINHCAGKRIAIFQSSIFYVSKQFDIDSTVNDVVSKIWETIALDSYRSRNGKTANKRFICGSQRPFLAWLKQVVKFSVANNRCITKKMTLFSSIKIGDGDDEQFFNVVSKNFCSEMPSHNLVVKEDLILFKKEFKKIPAEIRRIAISMYRGESSKVRSQKWNVSAATMCRRDDVTRSVLANMVISNDINKNVIFNV